jgi:predicted O-methyltransferase YrrM
MIVEERIAAYINSLTKELPSSLEELEKTAKSEGVPIIRKETQTFLKFLLSMKKPERILEIGTAVGFSAILMSEYMPPDCTITTIEKVEMRLVKARKNLASTARANQITLLEGDALFVLKQLVSDKMNWFDFIFLDAAKAQYMNFLPEIMKLLPLNGLLITDNVLQDGTVAESRYSIVRRDRTIHARMRDYLYTITHMEELETAILPVGDGVTISTRIKI